MTQTGSDPARPAATWRRGLVVVPWAALAAWVAASAAAATAADLGNRYLLVNLHASELNDDSFARIVALAGEAPTAPRLGVGCIISGLANPPEENLALLRRLLELALAHNVPVIVQLDAEQWWQARPDLWNWWDPDQPGFDPQNAANVEWAGWGPEHALKLAWRNWGQQLRVLPPPNLMSPRYCEASRASLAPLLDEIVRWKASLSAEQQGLLVGVKLGWESSLGTNAYYYPRGNDLLDDDPRHDPQQPLRPDELPGRGFQPIGYASVSSAGLAHDGELREDHLAEVVRRHLDELSRLARVAGLPREQVFTHSGGWKEEELLYRAAVNEHSCPGWSFYRHAADPTADRSAMKALATSDAPYWGAVEWLAVEARTADDWVNALATTLAAPRCRYLCIYNWRGIADNEAALAALGRVMKGD